MDMQTTRLAHELELAAKIIANAASIMTASEKRRWAEMNAHDGCNGKDVTRAHERERALEAVGILLTPHSAQAGYRGASFPFPFPFH
ncbi:MAG: hypothetical protein LBI92_07310 [Azoarcus sp.]|jgi:hypothetical protein|nr:hypothetical protein [Azoarcus sp.]